MAASRDVPAAQGRAADAAARRTRLRQYQEQLLGRMLVARTNDGANANQLGVEIGGVRYLLDLREAGEIVPVPPLAPVPLTQPWYLGLANVRGNLVGVVDLARYLGLNSTPASSNSQRLVTFGAALGLPCALLVSRVYGLRQAADMSRLDARVRDAEGNEWTPLALAALVRDERFLQVGL